MRPSVGAFRGYIALLALAALGATRVAAQTATTEETIKLPEFQVSTTQDVGYKAANSVSATRVNVAIKDLPFAINAFTSEFIKDTGAHDIFEVVQYAPGVTSAGREFTGGNSLFAIRGFNQAPQINGFPSPNSGFAAGPYVDTASIDRVEVVKGPASVLYGQVSPGGIVNYITKRATPKAFYNLTGTVGSYSYARGTADINQPLYRDKVLFRINAAAENGLQYFNPSKSTTTLVAPNLLIKVNEIVSVNIDYSLFDRKESPGVQFKPNIEIIRNVGTGAGAPALSTLNTNTTGILSATNTGAKNLDASDPGFLGYYPLPKNFNYSSQNDSRKSHYETFNTEVTIKLGQHWNSRYNLNYYDNITSQKLTGLGNVDITTPASYFANPALANGSNLAANWDAANLFAADLLNNPNLAVNAPNAVLVRRARVQIDSQHAYAAQAEAAGDYYFPWGDIKPLVGYFFNESVGFSRIRQSSTEAAPLGASVYDATGRSENFPTWNMMDPTTQDYTTDFDPNSLQSSATNPYSTNTRTVTRNYAFYGSLNGNFLQERLFTIAGIRYNRARTETPDDLVSGVPAFIGAPTPTLAWTNGGSTPPAPTLGTKSIAVQWTPQLGIGYKITKDIMAFGSYSESFQQQFAFLRSGNVPYAPAKPTTSKGYELGVKTDFLNGRISSTIGVYQIDQSNFIQTFNAIASGVTVSTDIAGWKKRSKGIEADVTYSPLKNLQIYASIAEDDVRLNGVPATDPFSGTPGVYSLYLGTHPEATVKTLGNLWTRYSFRGGFIDGLWVGAGFNYTGAKAQRVNNPLLFLPSTIIWNSALGYDWKWNKAAFTGALNWYNMTNKEYFPANQQRGLPMRVDFTVTAKF